MRRSPSSFRVFIQPPGCCRVVLAPSNVEARARLALLRGRVATNCRATAGSKSENFACAFHVSCNSPQKFLSSSPEEDFCGNRGTPPPSHLSARTSQLFLSLRAFDIFARNRYQPSCGREPCASGAKYLTNESRSLLCRNTRRLAKFPERQRMCLCRECATRHVSTLLHVAVERFIRVISGCSRGGTVLRRKCVSKRHCIIAHRGRLLSVVTAVVSTMATKLSPARLSTG